MILSIKKKFIWFHIPKTAGTSICEVLLPHQYTAKSNKNTKILEFPYHRTHINQLSAKDMIEPTGLYLKNYFEFVVVRNPYDRIISMFHWDLDFGSKRFFTVDLYLDAIEKHFAENNLEDFYNKQTGWTTHTITGKLNIFKFENLENDWKDICYKTNIDYVELPKLNTKSDERVTLTRAQKDRYYDLVKEEFELFGYDR